MARENEKGRKDQQRKQGMKIAVCAKQVPAVSEGDMDEKTGNIIRSGLKAVVNTYDLAALEAALRLKDRKGAIVHVFTMGPEKAKELLQETFGMGADEGFLVTGREFAGADVLATSYTLMQAIDAVGMYDLIVCGKQTTDGDTGQVSGALAKWMNIPHLNRVKQFQIAEEEGTVEAVYCMGGGEVTVRAALPCVVSVERESYTPRLPSLQQKLAGKKKTIHRISLKDLKDKDPSRYGLAGSPTRVKKIFSPPRMVRKEPVIFDKEEAVTAICSRIKLYQKADSSDHETLPIPPTPGPG